MKKPKEKIELNTEETTDLLQRLEKSNLSKSDQQLISSIIRMVMWVQFQLQEAKLSLKRLKKYFGFRPKVVQSTKNESDSDSEKDDSDNTKNESNSTKVDESKEHDGSEKEKQEQSSLNEEPSGIDSSSPENSSEQETASTSGHGRISQKDYKVTETKQINLDGDFSICDYCKGPTYKMPPLCSVHLIGVPPIQAIRVERHRIRCSRCQLIKVAPLPEEYYNEKRKPEKYLPSCRAMLVLMRSILGIPLYRLESWQKMMGVPLPDSTAFAQIERTANHILPLWENMEYEMAQREFIHQDDTWIKIISCIKENRREEPERRGMYTTGLLSFEKVPLVLFYSGRSHAGENLSALLRKRETLSPFYQVCDGLSANRIQEESTEVNCWAHVRLQFEDLLGAFTPEANYAIEQVHQLYQNEKKTKDLNQHERMLFHVQYSTNLVESFFQWGEDLIKKKNVEPNSSLGKAVKYLLKRRERLTHFLRIPGIPLDNSALERALRIVSRFRKNSLFYHNEISAKMGDMVMSISYSSILNNLNPFSYWCSLLTAPKESLPFFVKPRFKKE